MAIPAGNIGRAESAQSLILNDEIFENLVESGPDVYVSVGKWRTIMQNEFFRAHALRLDTLVKSRGFPFFQALRFTGH